MTSKNLCFKLMQEDLKRRVWAIALAVLGFLFTLLVPVAMECDNYLERIGSSRVEEGYRLDLVRQLVRLVGVNGVVIAFLLVLSVVWAVSGFYYLHSSRQVDLYHSIPVKRSQLFLAQYLNGLWVVAALYLAFQAMATALILRTGIGTEAVGSVPWRIALVNLAYYGMMYTTTVIAMMLTGNLIIALFGAAVFFGYGPAVVVLAEGYRQVCFATLFETEKQSEAWLRAVSNSSPFANYMFALADFQEGTLGAGRVLVVTAVTAALAVFACAIYKVRPSEAAGRAMAFEKTQMPIKILIAIPVGVVFGIVFFSELRSTIGWGVFGALCGSSLTCCLMEIIYHFDFRKLFCNWLHLAGCCAVSLLLILAGIYDWYGYDSYLPEASRIQSAAVVMGYAENWVTYGAPKKDEDPIYYWRYEDGTEYALNHMEIKEIDPVIALAKKGIAANPDRKGIVFERVDTGEKVMRCVVSYRLGGSKVVNRQYNIPMDEEAMMAQSVIHDSVEYKKGIYPLLGQLSVDTASVTFQQYNQLTPLNLSDEEKARLLSVYQKELEGLTMAQRETQLPVGSIQFRTLAVEEAVRSNELLEEGNGIKDRCYYPVYPSFEKTLEALGHAGVNLTGLNADDISGIRVLYYEVYEDGKVQWKPTAAGAEEWNQDYEKREAIEALSPALVFRDYYNMNEYYQTELAWNAEASVFFRAAGAEAEGGNGVTGFVIDLKKLSDEEAARFQLVGEEERVTIP